MKNKIIFFCGLIGLFSGHAILAQDQGTVISLSVFVEPQLHIDINCSASPAILPDLPNNCNQINSNFTLPMQPGTITFNANETGYSRTFTYNYVAGQINGKCDDKPGYRNPISCNWDGHTLKIEYSNN